MSNETVSFTAMEHGTKDDYELLDRLERKEHEALPDRLLDALRGLDDSLDGYQITRLEHSLQSATRARRDGADIDWVVAALVHDLGDQLAPYDHAAMAATIVRPFVREEVTWVVEQHGLFQTYYFGHHMGGDRNGRERYRDHPWFQLCVDFCARWDQASFDPAYESDALDSFEADLREVFTREPWDPSVIAAGPPVLVP